MAGNQLASRFLAAALGLCVCSAAFADDGAWQVRKSSGEVWMSTSGVQPAALTQEAELKPGDTIRTGRTGRVLLVRGEETIMIAPNSVIGVPADKKDGLSTTIVQQAGSILLEVEKRNVKHFEVETPYLAAVVKGTQFSVSVTASGTSVNVVRGQVEVADFKSGQIAQVLPGQVATSFARGNAGLSLSGSGTFNPIEQGKPRASSIDRITVPKTGLTAPRNAGNGPQFRAVGVINRAAGGPAPTTAQKVAAPPAGHGGLRISSSLGDVRLNFQKVTHGMARGTAPAPGGRNAARSADTVWSARDGKASTAASGNQGTSTDAVTMASSNSTAAAAVAASTAAASAATPVVVNAISNNGSGNGNSGATGNGRSDDNHHGRWWWGWNRGHGRN